MQHKEVAASDWIVGFEALRPVVMKSSIFWDNDTV
jgi:hypothetical protein